MQGSSRSALISLFDCKIFFGVGIFTKADNDVVIQNSEFVSFGESQHQKVKS